MAQKYLVLLIRTPNFQASMIAAHKEFLASLKAAARVSLAGPFADQAGGAYILHADSLDAAQQLAFTDPLYTSGSSEVTIYEWNAA